MRVPAALATCLLVSSAVVAQSTGTGKPATAGFDAARLARLDPVINAAIKEKLLPGAVLLVGRGDRTVLLKAYGNRAVVPAVEPMTVDTIFDVASLTKAVATATTVMQLVEQGRIRLTDRVSAHVPGFGKYGKQEITIRHLLTHVSGLRPDLDLTLEFEGHDEAIRRASEEVLEASPGERFIYSDINFFLLGDIVARVSGEPLETYARKHLFEPLGMKDTMFHPPAALRSRIAPTERCAPLAWPCDAPNAPMLRGVVHDPTARRMGGAAGHAGLFSTAADLAIYARMLLRGGEVNGVRVLAPLTVAKMTQPASPPGHRNQRGLGWDIDSMFSANRGELLPVGSFGHTGFTGTSIWIDPGTQIYVVFLSNRVHPDGKGDVTPLRARVATLAAAAFADLPSEGGSHGNTRQMRMTATDFGPSGPTVAGAGQTLVGAGFSRPVLAGIDVLRAENFARLRGKKIGLLTHLAARAQDGTSTLDVFRNAPGVQLASILSPEHGLAAALDSDVASARDQESGLAIHSLYGETQRPTPAMLEGIDAIVIDLVDVGARFYTYPTTVAYVMEEAARKKIPVIVLDRPNPITGAIEGPTLDDGLAHFAGYFSMPARHGLTLAELATLFNGENKIGADLSVVAARGWQRDQWFDETALMWTNPSPNMRNLHQATLYPGIGAIEWTNVSVGRGTETPFEQVGAPWIDGAKLSETLNARRLPGIRFYPVRFTPASSVYANEACEGVFMVVTDRNALRPVRLGVEIAAALHKLHPDKFDFRNTVRLLGSQATIDRIRKGDDPAEIAASWSKDEAEWRLRRNKYLIYRPN
jgi:uncharacterized protein YbbC (DUF1343 family)/CubicO group peptidase (beta-lactamase class C family)